jgi:uncharacterized membrane protein
VHTVLFYKLSVGYKAKRLRKPKFLIREYNRIQSAPKKVELAHGAQENSKDWTRHKGKERDSGLINGFEEIIAARQKRLCLVAAMSLISAIWNPRMLKTAARAREGTVKGQCTTSKIG